MKDFDSQLKALRHVYPVSRELFSRLEIIADSLVKWQKRINLVAPSTLDDLWHRHVADSLQSVAIARTARQWLDIGSGGGFPGLVVAAAMADYTDAHVDMIESNQKKVSFLRQTARQVGGSAKVHAMRIEEGKALDLKPQIVTARALAALPKLLELASPWLLAGSVGLFHKGREFEVELAECNGLWSFDLVNHPSSISEDSVVLEIRNLKRLVA